MTRSAPAGSRPVSHLFGPVPSRRLGISLGVDIIPFKTCSMNCIYCESGKTTHLTVKRKRFVDPDIVLQELRVFLDTYRDPLDYITFSGSGEPTLHRDLGYLIKQIKKMTGTPLALLTNSTLLARPEVREELLPVDVLLPSLDAVTAETFQKINQPHQKVDLPGIIQGLIDFNQVYQGKMWLEIFILKGVNDSPEELARLYDTLKKIKPHKIQLNTIDRPPAYSSVRGTDILFLENLKKKWSPFTVEVIRRIKRRKEILSFCKNLENSILNTIIRRPLTLNDLVVITGKKPAELLKYLDLLSEEKKIRSKIINGKIFYVPEG